MPRVVQRSKELARILALPRRKWEEEADAEACELLTQHFRRSAGKMYLYPVQCAGLAELADHGGAFLQAGVGQGKTLISALASHAAEAERPLLFVPANLKAKTVREFRALNVHWHVNPIRIESYEQLSRAESGRVLLGEKIDGQWRGYLPDLLVLDEGHKAKNPRAACTRKLRRYIRERRADGFTVKVVVMSGTLAKRSIKDFAHLAEWCFPEGPLPQHQHELMLWADAVDEGVSKTKRAEPGALLIFPGAEGETPVERARRGLQRRIFETPGFIATTSNEVADCSLVIECHQIDVPPEVDAAFAKIKAWETPCGLPISSGIELWRHCRELATDFYFRPRTKPPVMWLTRRREWFAKVRKRLQYNHKSLDSIAMVERDVAEAGDHGCSVYDRTDHGEEKGCPKCQIWDAFVAWKAIEDTYHLDNEPVWVGTTCLDWVAEWHEKNGPGLIWVEAPVVGERIAKHLGIEYYGRNGLNKHKQPIESEKGDRSAVASIRANGTGRNLQTIWSRALVTSAPPTGQDNDQMIGRLHRPDQLADSVKFDYMIACREQLSGFMQAMRDADFHAECLGSELKILPGQKSADILLPPWCGTGGAWAEPVRV